MSRVEIDDSLPGDTLAYLINFLHYPTGHNLDGRGITAIAIVSRGEFLGAPSEFADSRAIVYVPSNDTEYDQVFVRIDPGGYYRISFTRLQWLPVADGREPAAVRRLSNDAFK